MLLFTGMCDHLVANSNSVRDAFTGLGVSPSRITTIHNGTEIPETVRSLAPAALRRIGIIGRLVEWKGLRDFVTAAKFVTAAAPNVQFEIFGNEDPSEPHFKEEIATQIHELGLCDRVVFRGYATKLADVYSSLYCLVNASHPAEPFGNSIIEAMANGCPVIATDGGGPREVIEHRWSGLLVRPNAPDEIARCVLGLLRDPQERERLALNARARVRDAFEVKQQGGKQEELLDTFCDSRTVRVRKLLRVSFPFRALRASMFR